MKRKLVAAYVGLAFTAAPVVASADVIFNGFGQVVGGSTLSNNRVFPYFPSNSNYSADPDFRPESNFALQVTAPISDSITAVAQVLALGEDDFSPKFQWAYIKFQLNNTFALKVGRVQTPLYKYSDFLFVGEAYPWLRLPRSVYTTSPFTNADGIALTADRTVGDWDFYTQVLYDNTPRVLVTNNPNGLANAQVTNAINLSEDITYQSWLTMRGSLVVGRLTSALTCDGSVRNPATFAGGPAAAYGLNAEAFATCTSNYIVNALHAQGYTEAEKNLVASNDLTAFWTAGFQADRWNWTVIGEYVGQINRQSYVSNFETSYLTVGYHVGKLFPFLTYGHYHAWMHDRASNNVPAGAYDPYLPPAIVNGNPVPVVTFQNEIDAIRSSAAEHAQDNYYSLGLRYDLTSNVALKFDWTHYHSTYSTPNDPAIAGAIQYARSVLGASPEAAAAPFTKGPDANLVSAAITFAF